MTSTSPRVGRRATLLGTAAVVLLSCLTPTSTGAAAASPRAAAPLAAVRAAAAAPVMLAHPYNRSNPLAGRTWGVPTDMRDNVYPYYARATGLTKARLARIALTPRVRWFGAWMTTAQLPTLVRNYIASVKGGRNGGARTVVQAAVFRLVPNEYESCGRIATRAEVDAYKKWITVFASAVNANIGDARMAIVLEPDLPHWECSPGRSTLHRRMTAFAAATLSKARNTSIYIDAGASDWRSVPQAVDLLRNSGIRYARGFSLNNTHYTTTTDNVNHAYALSLALARAGLGTKYAVINTSNNGQGFTYAWYHSRPRGAQYDNAPTCTSRTQTHCVTLGIPATTDVTNPTWGLAHAVDVRAARRVDGYVWSGKSWRTMQANPFDMARAINMARTGRYMSSYPTR